MTFRVIKGSKNGPFEVSGMNSDEGHPDPSHVTEVVIVNREPHAELVGGRPAGVRTIVAGPVSLADRPLAEAFCKAMNDFYQYEAEYDWDRHDMNRPMPPCPGSAT